MAVEENCEARDSLELGKNVDNILRKIGSVGRYQKMQLLLLMIFILEDSFHLISSVYIAYRPSYQCNQINSSVYVQQINLTGPYELDIVYEKCYIKIDVNMSSTGMKYPLSESCVNGYQYSIPVDRTTVTEWDLVCNGAERSEFAQTLIMLGQATGALIFSPLSDRIGRKPCNVLARILYFFTALATVFCPNITVFLILRYLQGTFQGGSVMTTTILYTELFPKELRHKAEAAGLTAWTTGLVLTSLIGYFCRNLSWRYMQLILALITCHALFDWLILDESFRWLLANGKRIKAENILKKASRMNNVPFPIVTETISTVGNVVSNKEDITTRTSIVEGGNNLSQTMTDSVPEKYTILTILKNKRMLVCSVILWIAWITNTLTYYGLMLTTSKLSGDRYLNNILASLAEYPAVIVQILLVNRIGRKCMLIVFHGIAAISMILAMVCTTYDGELNWLPTLGTVFSLIGRFAITGSFSTVFLYTPELYPTNLRNAGLGLASLVSRTGSMLSPFAMTLSDYIPWGPAAIFAGLNFLVTISLTTLPETMGRVLPTTVTELRSWYTHKQSCNVFKKKKYTLKK